MVRIVTYTPSKKKVSTPSRSKIKPTQMIVTAASPKERRHRKQSFDHVEISPEVEDFFRRNVRPRD